MSTTPRKPEATTARSLGTGSTFRDRLGIYLIGVAIGFLLLGMLWMAKNAATGGATPAQPNSAAAPSPQVNNPALMPNATTTPK
jgi:hypothetical protein